MKLIDLFPPVIRSTPHQNNTDDDYDDQPVFTWKGRLIFVFIISSTYNYLLSLKM